MYTKFIAACLIVLGLNLLIAQQFVTINGSQLPNSVNLPAPTNSNRGYMFATFSAYATSSGALNLMWGTSPTVFAWTPPLPSLPTYQCFTRDPSIINWGGTYALVHTGNGGPAGCASPAGTSMPITVATNTTTWTFGLPIIFDFSAAFPAGNTWAPEWFPDPQNCTYHTDGTGWSCTTVGNLHVFFAGCAGGTGCFQINEIHPTASDFLTNTASWSAPAAITITAETNTIDPFVVWRPDVSKYFIFYNHNGSACINWASSATLTGTYTDVATNQCFGLGAVILEGTSLIQTVAGSPGTWQLCTDNLGAVASFTLGNYFCGTSTDGFSTWSTFVKLSGPGVQIKQGTMIPFP